MKTGRLMGGPSEAEAKMEAGDPAKEGIRQKGTRKYTDANQYLEK